MRWRDPATGRRLVEEFATVEDALDFQARLRLATRGGVLDELGRGGEARIEEADGHLTLFAHRVPAVLDSLRERLA